VWGHKATIHSFFLAPVTADLDSRPSSSTPDVLANGSAATGGSALKNRLGKGVPTSKYMPAIPEGHVITDATVDPDLAGKKDYENGYILG
jgi:hypothetical protein